MNIQTEHLDDHRARFTVEVDQQRFEKAKRKAASKIARSVNIPGFRKGKAPYNILVQYGFEANIINDAIDDLTQVIYRETLEQETDIQPYGPGALEDIKLEEAPKFIYTVPLQPTVELGEYREVRVEYDEPEITDELVDQTMKRLQRQEALIEESTEPVAVGNSVTIDIHSEFADGEEREYDEDDLDDDELEDDAAEDDTSDEAIEDTVEDEDTDEDDEDDLPLPYKGDPYIHEHDAEVMLDPDDEPILPGFIDALVGANVGDTVEFELTVPDDEEEDAYDGIRGRKILFQVDIKKVESVTLPELTDDFAARLTEEEDEPLTLLQLRMRIRDNLETEARNRQDSDYAMRVLDDMVAISSLSYPEMMVEDQMQSMVDEFDQRLRQQGLSLETYSEVTGMDVDHLKETYRDQATETVERSLVLSELVVAENIKVKEPEIEVKIDEILSQFGDQADALRGAFDTPSMRDSIVNDLTQQKIIERIITIGKGEEIVDDDDELDDEEETEVETLPEEVEATVPVEDTVLSDDEDDADEDNKTD